MKQFCRYKNHFIEDSSVMMLMDLYKNGDLAQAIADQKGEMFETRQLLDWFEDILNGAVFLHQNGVWHTNLKPANIFITNSNSLIIGDYGLYKLLGKMKLEDKFWPPAAIAVNVQSLLHANSRYLRDIPPASASSSRHY